MKEGVWAQGRMVGGNDTWVVTVPGGLREGAYLMRHEVIALHVPFAPEFYPECAHLFVTGGGGQVPGEEFLVEIPGVWREDGEFARFLAVLCREVGDGALTDGHADPELYLSIYEEPTASRAEWTIPGPPVWSP